MEEFFIGLLLGFLTGFLPGLHPNLLASLLAQTTLADEQKAFMLIGAASANIIVSFVIAIFFGIPDENTVASILPGHRLTLAGRGLTALRASLAAMLLSAVLSIILFVPSLSLYPIAYAAIRDYIKYVVLFLAVVMIVKSKNPLLALIIFTAAGFLGYYSLHAALPDPFLPMFSGMFALAALLNITKTELPKQKKEDAAERLIVPYAVAGVLLGFLSNLLPGISSPAQMAILVGLVAMLQPLEYLALVCSISVSQAIFSFATAATIAKARIGTTAWLLKFAALSQDPLFFASLFFFGAVAAVAILFFIRKKISAAAALNSRTIAAALIIYLALVCFIIDGYHGLLIMALGALLGFFTIKLNVERVQMMGAIVLPTLLLLFKIFL